VLCVEPVFAEALQETGLANARVAENYELEGVNVLVLHEVGVAAS